MNTHLLRAAGLLWLIVGLFLLTRGIDLVVADVDAIPLHLIVDKGMSPFFSWLSGKLGTSTEASLAYIIGALFIGMMKARTVFRKIVQRNVERIRTLKDTKLPFFHAFPKKDYLIMVSMMLLGVLMKAFGVYEDIRGFILIAVGAALIQGSMIYFRAYREVPKT